MRGQPRRGERRGSGPKLGSLGGSAGWWSFGTHVSCHHAPKDCEPVAEMESVDLEVKGAAVTRDPVVETVSVKLEVKGSRVQSRRPSCSRSLTSWRMW